jgi:colicin import membrane protein
LEKQGAATQAELWQASDAPSATVPKLEPTKPEPKPEPKQEPKPIKPEPEPPAAKLVPKPPKVIEPSAADIALQKKKEEERRKGEAKRIADEKKRQEAKQLAEEKAKREAEKAKKEADQRKLAEEKQKQDDERKRNLPMRKKKTPSASFEKPRNKSSQACACRPNRPYAADGTQTPALDRISARQGNLGGSREGNSAQGLSAGAGGQGSSLDAGYAGNGGRRFGANTVFGRNTSGNPRAEFAVSLSTSCEVLQVRLKSSSGNNSWDEAAERAISRTTPFPKPPSGSCPSSMLISHQPKDGPREGMM